MTDRQLLEQLLKAWESAKADLLLEAIKAIRERLAQPEASVHSHDVKRVTGDW